MMELLKPFSCVTLALVVMSSLGYADASTECPPGWRYNSGSCYGFGQAKVSWGDAVAICQTYKAKLAEPETSAENDFLKQMARDNKAGNVWIGGNDIFLKGSYEWNIANTFVYSDWNNGEPNHAGGAEFCMTLWSSANYGWNDWACHNNGNFICERAPIVQET